MTSDDDELRLNRLYRYRKTSRQMLLEAHSHCEVPAGCGGVVLRWRRPGGDVGLWLYAYLGPSCGPLHVDGVVVEEMRLTVSSGPHVLSFVVDKPKANAGLLLFDLHFDPQISSALHTALAARAHPAFRATGQEPAAEGWRLPGFDDAAWRPLVDGAVAPPRAKKDRWRFDHFDGARGLGVDASVAKAKRAFVRLPFFVDAAGLHAGAPEDAP